MAKNYSYALPSSPQKQKVPIFGIHIQSNFLYSHTTSKTLQFKFKA